MISIRHIEQLSSFDQHERKIFHVNVWYRNQFHSFVCYMNSVRYDDMFSFAFEYERKHHKSSEFYWFNKDFFVHSPRFRDKQEVINHSINLIEKHLLANAARHSEINRKD